MILEQIISNKRIEVEKHKANNPLFPINFETKSPGQFKKAIANPGMSLIAEVKKASPSKGIFLNEFDPVELARCYEDSGAATISVLTESNIFKAPVSI